MLYIQVAGWCVWSLWSRTLDCLPVPGPLLSQVVSQSLPAPVATCSHQAPATRDSWTGGAPAAAAGADRSVQVSEVGRGVSRGSSVERGGIIHTWNKQGF